ncbi:DUF6602 domain-containing protein [Peribacillus sp. NPDC096622]|uniref:DUF6602 domain-containing protein n=1 Tax=Peribacillus sp. NPDC096622 TaxID=3364396 RepID=UPI0037FFEFA0
MRYSQDLPSYYKSFAKELDVVKDRIRNIIGSKHWGSDGSHKEAVLKGILKKFIPSEFEVASGFIVNEKGECSKQIDILVYQNSSPILFHSTDFVIIPNTYVKAVIEVKTDLKSDTLITALDNLFSAQQIINKSSSEVHTAIFAYDYNRDDDRIKEQNISKMGRNVFDRIENYYRCKDNFLTEEFLRTYALGALCINQKLYGLHWNEDTRVNCEFGIYKTKDDSFNFFVSNLLSSLDSYVTAPNTLWYPNEKESRIILRKSFGDIYHSL